MIVTTKGDSEFDEAQVEISNAKVDDALSVGDEIEITIEPEIRESYPVQVTATKVELLEVKYRKITAKEAKEMIDQGENDIILDVRTIEEYNEGHIEGAVLLPNNQVRDKAEAILSNKEEVILVYCRSGRRSEGAAKELIDMGYTNVYDFGGIVNWPYEVIKE